MQIRLNQKILEGIELPIIFIIMILSSGISLGLVFRMQLTFESFELLAPLIFASYVSCHRFYNIVMHIEKGKFPKTRDKMGDYVA